MDVFVSRMIRAARLEPGLYEEIEADRGSMGQALLVVVLASLAAGIAGIGVEGAAGLIANTVAALLGWFAWAAVTLVIGTRLLPEPQTQADLGQLLRVTGFSNAPGLLRILGVLPLLYWPVMLVTGIWILLAMIVAIRQALDYTTTTRAVAVAFIGWLFYLVVLIVFAAVAGVAGA
jgi:hypothetical protein